MSMLEIVEKSIAETKYQLDKVLSRINEQNGDIRIASKTSTPKETLRNLNDAYVVFIALCEKKPFEFGSYEPEEDTIQCLKKDFESLHEKCMKYVQQNPDNKETLHNALGFLSIHDSHHVGVLGQFLTQTDPTWNTYSIYVKEEVTS